MNFFLEFLEYFNQYCNNVLSKYRDKTELIDNENLRGSLRSNNLEPSYKACIGILEKILKNNHPKFLTIDNDFRLNNLFFYKNKDISIDDVFRRDNTALACDSCFKYYMENRGNLAKIEDLIYGAFLEKRFTDFLSNILPKINNSDWVVKRADLENFHNPDFCIEKNGNEVLFIEFKTIFRPFLIISKLVDPNYRCFSHSLTLDVGKKIEKQKEIVEERGIKTIYLYWYDTPCMKGFYWEDSEVVYRNIEAKYSRIERDGDFNSWGTKNSTTDKIYLNVFEMQGADSFLELLRKL